MMRNKTNFRCLLLNVQKLNKSTIPGYFRTQKSRTIIFERQDGNNTFHANRCLLNDVAYVDIIVK
jgi:hypothetical protein